MSLLRYSQLNTLLHCRSVHRTHGERGDTVPEKSDLALTGQYWRNLPNEWKLRFIRACVFLCVCHARVCVWEVGADGRGLWIFVAVTVDIVDKFFCHHVLLVSTAWVSELLCVVTHTAVLSTQCNSEKGLLSNSVAFRMLFKRHYSVLCRHCVILKIHKRKITNDIWYELV